MFSSTFVSASVPTVEYTGHTTATWAMFGSVITAAFGTTHHCPSNRTQYALPS